MQNILLVSIVLATITFVGGCATPPELDWKYRKSVFDMQPSTVDGVVGTISVAGRVDASAFTEDALWMVVSTPVKGVASLPVNRVVKINLNTNRLYDLFSVDGFAGSAIATDADSVWVTEGLGGNNVYRVDPKKDLIVASIQLDRNPIAIAVGERAVWVLAAEQTKYLGRILLNVSGLALYKINASSNTLEAKISIPQTGKATEITAGSIAVGAGSVWISSRSGDVVRIDPRTNKIVASIPMLNARSNLDLNYQVVVIKERVMLIRRTVKDQTTAAMVRMGEAEQTEIWHIDPQSNQIGKILADFKEEGVVILVSDSECWIGSTRNDEITQCDPITFMDAGPPKKIGYPVYGLAFGNGTLWAFTGAKITKGDERDISWISRIVR